ncbi:uncharacterized protein LOC106013299 [Aplysia californica]|uniref:Uncharacterized protein LOC106013299 n=1 Tax=Aplysia californica TaxID=6500 RepID=A0ABM1AAN2_APLCA|nr:uncharacterized protein LOC106013299 [Aplysia californica]
MQARAEKNRECWEKLNAARPGRLWSREKGVVRNGGEAKEVAGMKVTEQDMTKQEVAGVKRKVAEERQICCGTRATAPSNGRDGAELAADTTTLNNNNNNNNIKNNVCNDGGNGIDSEGGVSSKKQRLDGWKKFPLKAEAGVGLTSAPPARRLSSTAQRDSVSPRSDSSGTGKVREVDEEEVGGGVRSSHTDVLGDCENLHDARVSVSVSHMFPCISRGLAWATHGREPLLSLTQDDLDLLPLPAGLSGADHVQVLVTGSLLLVGGVLTVIDPGMND